MKMRSFLSLLCAVCILAVCFIPFAGAAAVNDSPSRVINLVYDDSSSMIETDIKDANGEIIERSVQMDTWCKAKYATEVFAALLGEKDTLNIFYMSDFSRSTISEKPKLVLEGKDGAEVNVRKVHNLVTEALDTPFKTVETAYNNLTTKTADEKWLVVLTDGEFYDKDDIDGYFRAKSSDIKVMFLAMGSQADGITQDTANGIFYKQAVTSDAILNEITDIARQIFNRDRLNCDINAKKLVFDVPMSELIVFAQGANVQINGIKDEDGKLYQSSSSPVTVRYSEKPATNYSEFIVDKNLTGSIATFRDDFPAGTYTVDVSGAQTVEVYYKPNVEITAFLKDTNGSEVTDLANLEAGEYTIHFGLVKSGTEEQLPTSELLGQVSYEAVVTNNGTTHEQTYSSGDKIQLTEGSLSIRATARYLEYNTVSTALDFTVFRNKQLDFTVIEGPVYNVLEQGFEDVPPTRIKATVDGRDLTAEEWEALQLPTVTKTEGNRMKLHGFTVEKSDEPGVLNVYPDLNGKPNSAIYSDCELQLYYEAPHGIETWTASCTVRLSMTDSRTWIERNRDLFIRIVIAAAIAVFLFGYVPGVKKYIPKAMKKHPRIDVNPVSGSDNTQPGYTDEGSVKKGLFSTVIPYRKQTAMLVYTTEVATTLKLRAVSKNTMIVTNTDELLDETALSIGGQKVRDPKKKIFVTPATSITYTTDMWQQKCRLNAEYSDND